MVLPMTYLSRGKSAPIIWVAALPPQLQQLQKLGLLPTHTISLLFIGPFHRFSICRIDRNVVPLKKSVMNMVFVEI